MVIGGTQEHQHWRDDGISPALTEAMGKGGGQTPIITRAPIKYPGRNGTKVDGDYAFTVDTVNTGGVAIDSRIRRLTPIECERLQGLPDDFTKYGVLDGKVVEISDTQRYKTCGNGMTTYVIEAIVARMIETGCLPGPVRPLLPEREN